jgi:phenylacetic acid degradation operon negative regulatory protein
MVTEAWDLPTIEAEYEHFVTEFRSQTPGDVLVRQLQLVHAWRRFPTIDPALPLELLPTRWSGVRASQVFAERHSHWTEDAHREWKRLNSL